MNSHMAPNLKKAIAEEGHAFLREYNIGEDTLSAAFSVGTPLIVGNRNVVEVLRPRKSAPPNTYSGIYGLASFPFHSDLAHWENPPRYILLRCIIGYDDVTTLLLSGTRILCEELTDLMSRSMFTNRRPVKGAMKLLRLHEKTGDGYRLRWDEAFLTPVNNFAESVAAKLT